MKKILSFSLALLMLIAICIPSFAYTSYNYDYDYDDYDSDYYYNQTTKKSYTYNYPRNVVDDANIIPDDTEKELSDLFTEWQAKYETDVVIFTIDEVIYGTGDDIVDMAADVFDYFGYGVGSSKSGVILLICTEPGERSFAVVTSGKEVSAFDGKESDMKERIEKYLKDEDYEGAALAYAGLTGSMLEYGNLKKANKVLKAELGEDFIKEEGFKISNFSAKNFLVALIAGLVIGFAVAETLKKQMTPVRIAVSARNHLVDGSFNLRHQTVMFLHSEVVRHAKPKNNSRGGGSVGHSGSSHGGSGGRF